MFECFSSTDKKWFWFDEKIGLNDHLIRFVATSELPSSSSINRDLTLYRLPRYFGYRVCITQRWHGLSKMSKMQNLSCWMGIKPFLRNNERKHILEINTFLSEFLRWRIMILICFAIEMSIWILVVLLTFILAVVTFDLPQVSILYLITFLVFHSQTQKTYKPLWYDITCWCCVVKYKSLNQASNRTLYSINTVDCSYSSFHA